MSRNVHFTLAKDVWIGFAVWQGNNALEVLKADVLGTDFEAKQQSTQIYCCLAIAAQ